MKTLGLLIIGLFLTLPSLVSAKPYGKAGCGLGSRVMGKDSQVLAATTNGTSGNQTFGISSGTSGCVDSKTNASLYIQNNQLALSNDVAKGQGETITGLAHAYGCTDPQLLGSRLQLDYSSIFASTNTQPAEIENSIRSVIHSDAGLSKTCSST